MITYSYRNIPGCCLYGEYALNISLGIYNNLFGVFDMHILKGHSSIVNLVDSSFRVYTGPYNSTHERQRSSPCMVI